MPDGRTRTQTIVKNAEYLSLKHYQKLSAIYIAWNKAHPTDEVGGHAISIQLRAVRERKHT